MTHPHNPDESSSKAELEPSPSSPRRCRRLRRAALGVGLLSILGLAGGAWWAWIYIHESLAPQIARSLSQQIGRPVTIGPLQDVDLSHLEFGPSLLPATAADPDRLSVQSIRVDFNLLDVLTSRALNLDLTLNQVRGYVEQDADQRWVTLEFQPQESKGPLSTNVNTIRIRDGQFTAVPYPETPGAVMPLVVEDVSGRVRLLQDNQDIRFDLEGQIQEQGQIALEGQFLRSLQALKLNVQGQDLQASTIDRLVDLPALSFQSGQVSGNLTLVSQPDQPLELRGTAQVESANFQIPAVPRPFTDVSGLLRLQGRQLGFEQVKLNYGEIPGVIGGSIDFDEGYDLRGRIASVEADAVLQTLDISAPFPVAGLLQSDLQLQGPLAEPLLLGSVVTQRGAQIDRVPFAKVQGQFRLDGTELTFQNLQGTPTVGGQVTGSGRIRLGEEGGLVFDFQGEDLPGDAIAQLYDISPENINFGRVNATAQLFGRPENLQTVLNWRAPNATYPGQGEVAIAGDTIEIQRTTLQVAGGPVNVQATVRNGQYQGRVTGSGVQLRQFSPQLQGTAGGDLIVSGPLENFGLTTLNARGTARFPAGAASFANTLATFNQPLTAEIIWDGRTIQVQQAQSENLQAKGTILVDMEGAEGPGVEQLNLTVDAENYSLAALPVDLPYGVQLGGTADFVGQVSGPPDDVALVGDLQLNRLTANNRLAFEPILTGDFRYQPSQGLNLDVQGQQDQLTLITNANNRPQSFQVQLGEAIARGQSQRPDQIQVDLANFPIAALDLPSLANLGPVQGRLNANLDVDLAQNTAVGEVAIAQPQVGYIQAERFSGNLRYTDGVARLSGGELRLGDSLLLLQGQFQPGPTPIFQASIDLEQTDLQDILTALQVFDLEDLGRGLQPPEFARADALETADVGLASAPLLTQLRRFAEINDLLAQQRAERDAASPLPPLATLSGDLTGSIEVANSAQEGLQVEFDVLGQDWQWDGYELDRAIASGNYEDGVLTLLPLRFEGSDDLLLTFSGQIGGEEQSGQLRAENLPIEALRDFVDVPVELAGDLNATATLGGSLENPQVLGELALQEGFINRTPVQSAQGRFNYADARLNLLSSLTVEGPEPVTLQASIPYRFPFMTVTPDSDRINIALDVENEGLAVLNALNRQVMWESGEGEIQLQVTGSLSNPVAQGIARLENATLRAQALPAPLTDVTGEIRFDRDRIIVDDLRGQFSRGDIVADGTIPLLIPFMSRSGPDSDNPPLVVNLNDAELALKGLYNGNVSGAVQVTGSAFAPNIGGEIVLSNGRIALPEEGEPVAGMPGSGEEGLGAPLQFNDLVLTLGNNVQITKEPILAFVASGALTLNGSLGDIRPQGTIELERGLVNLFTTRFRLANGYPQTAIFTPSQGLNPILDVRLVTSITEVNRAPIAETTPFATSEVQDVPVSTLGGLQTVRIFASVEGPASELFNNLQLSSSPARSETEIVSLLGGGFLDTQGRGDSTLAIANLAGSTLLGNVQDLIGTAIGLSEFRLFPTYTFASNATEPTGLGLGAEAGINLTSDVSASVLLVLTDSTQPARFNLRYRLNEDLLLRGSTDLNEDSSVVLEYETRF